LLLEDLHWADPTTVELLQEVLRLAERIQLLVLLASAERSATGLPASMVAESNANASEYDFAGVRLIVPDSTSGGRFNMCAHKLPSMAIV
jgi:hypothetical protein